MDTNDNLRACSTVHKERPSFPDHRRIRSLDRSWRIDHFYHTDSDGMFVVDWLNSFVREVISGAQSIARSTYSVRSADRSRVSCKSTAGHSRRRNSLRHSNKWYWHTECCSMIVCVLKGIVVLESETLHYTHCTGSTSRHTRVDRNIEHYFEWPHSLRYSGTDWEDLRETSSEYRARMSVFHEHGLTTATLGVGHGQNMQAHAGRVVTVDSTTWQLLPELG